MAERGSIGGLDFRFEQFPSQAVPPAQVGGFGLPPAQVSVPEFDNDPLAVREKLTNDYYSNMGLIRSFAEDMSKKGIDPFEPDYSQEGGGLAFQTMQKLQAGLMFAANALKNEFQREKQVNEAVLRGDARIRSDFDPTSQMFTQTPDAAFSTQLDPRIAAANQRTAQNVFTQRDANAVNQAVFDPTQAAIQGDPNMSAEERAFQQSALFPSVPETSYQQLIPRGGRSGVTQEDLSRRAELIRQVKSGILTNDQTPLNMIRLVPGVEDVEYVNTGDKVGLQVYMKGGATSFVDLTKGGEGEINAFLNRIEGQKNVPNEMVFQFDTKVPIPSSNSRLILDEVKSKAQQLDQPTIQKFQELAAMRKLITPDGGVITKVEYDSHWFKPNDIKITYHPVEGSKINYSKTRTMNVSDPAEIDSFIEVNANNIAPAFGGGFVDPNAPQAPAIDPDI